MLSLQGLGLISAGETKVLQAVRYSQIKKEKKKKK